MSREIINKVAPSGFTGQGKAKIGSILGTAGGERGRSVEENYCALRAELQKKVLIQFVMLAKLVPAALKLGVCIQSRRRRNGFLFSQE
jgi:hypothetical protein